MKFWDFWAEHLHWWAKQRCGGLAHTFSCRLGLHWWGYLGEIDCQFVGQRHLWACCRCPAEKWLRLTKWK